MQPTRCCQCQRRPTVHGLQLATCLFYPQWTIVVTIICVHVNRFPPLRLWRCLQHTTLKLVIRVLQYHVENEDFLHGLVPILAWSFVSQRRKTPQTRLGCEHRSS